ncbi:MAG: molybdopterin cofactor-binding domain-containing protein, partial [Actinomycetota bacterium]
MDDKLEVVGHNERRVDGSSLVTGKPVFVADLPERSGTLHLALKTSPHAHARIRSIDTTRAEALEGVALVLTHENTPDKPYTTAGQGYPEPSPYDARMFDSKVRFVGDRVAAVAADSIETARAALELIEVDYELLEPVLSIDAALAADAPQVHDEPCPGAWRPEENIAAYTEAVTGDVEAGLAAAHTTVDVTVETHYGQHAPIETHVVSSYLDENDRLVLVTSTQVPFHARRIIAYLLDVPVHRIRVIKPRIGGGFGVKQEVLIEDLLALTTLRTGRPATMSYTREHEFYASRTRHPMRIRTRLGAEPDGTITAIDMDVLSNTGAYGTHSLTVLSNVGSKTLPLYNLAPNVRFHGRAVYT